MRHLVVGQRQKAPYFSAFHLLPHGCLITIGQNFVTKRVVHLPKRIETSLITESDQSRANHQLLQLWTVCTAWSNSGQAVWAVHICKSWFQADFDPPPPPPQTHTHMRLGFNLNYIIFSTPSNPNFMSLMLQCIQLNFFLSAKKLKTKFTSANSQNSFHPSYVKLRIKRLEARQAA